MTRLSLASLFAFACSAFLTEAVRAESAKEILEKAVEAHGGEANLKKYTAAVVTMKGTISASGLEIGVEGSGIYQLPDRLKTTLSMDVMGKKFTLVQILNAGKAKLTVNNESKPLDEAQQRELKDALYLQDLQNLYGLLDKKKFEISLIDKPENVGDKEVYGLLIKSNGMKDVKMFFDKKTFTLAQIEGKGLGQDGKEADRKLVILEHKKIDGVLRPLKSELFMDGKKFMSSEMISYKHLDKADPKEFDISD